jgi:hypothetical protein
MLHRKLAATTLGLALTCAGVDAVLVACGGDNAEHLVDAATDTGVVEAASVEDVALACPPQLDAEAGYPAWLPPGPLYQNRCTGGQIAEIVHCFFLNNREAIACTALDAGNYDACATCLFTSPTADASGPVIVDGPIARLNVAGCIAELVGNPTCGPLYGAFETCTAAACARCLDPDGSTLNDFEACRTAAAGDTCAVEANAAGDCVAKELQRDGSASLCLQAGSFSENAIRLGQLFCTLDGGG